MNSEGCEWFKEEIDDAGQVCTLNIKENQVLGEVGSGQEEERDRRQIKYLLSILIFLVFKERYIL